MEPTTPPPQSNKSVELIQNLTAGLTVSFVAISLGAAFGVLSGRGAFAGILSAGVIAFITALFGGTRIQCSGPTAPMTAVTVLLVAFAGDQLLTQLPQADTNRFINMVLVLTGGIMVLAALLRLGRFIMLVPKTVISGFMNGIAILIWVDQVKKLFGLGGKDQIEGPLAINLGVAVCTLVLVFVVPRLVKSYLPKARLLFPGTIVAIVLMTCTVQLLKWDIQFITLNEQLTSIDDLTALVSDNLPNQWSWDLILLGLPFAAQLAMLAYLDSLLTALVVDKKLKEKTGSTERTNQNRELAAQGVANAAVSLFGGIPGAQATIRSVLILNENATLRLAGVSVGVFVAIEMVLFQGYLNLIPQAVFTGILFKVGYDVFDWPPVVAYLKGFGGAGLPGGDRVPQATGLQVAHWDMLFIGGTALVTLLVNLNVAVISFTVLFYLIRLATPLPDLHVQEETGDPGSPASARSRERETSDSGLE